MPEKLPSAAATGEPAPWPGPLRASPWDDGQEVFTRGPVEGLWSHNRRAGVWLPCQGPAGPCVLHQVLVPSNSSRDPAAVKERGHSPAGSPRSVSPRSTPRLPRRSSAGPGPWGAGDSLLQAAAPPQWRLPYTLRFAPSAKLSSSPENSKR